MREIQEKHKNITFTALLTTIEEKMAYMYLFSVFKGSNSFNFCKGKFLFLISTLLTFLLKKETLKYLTFYCQKKRKIVL